MIRKHAKKLMGAIVLITLTTVVVAHNNVVVIPLGSEPTVNIDALLARIVVLETKLACVDATSNGSSFKLEGCDVSINAPDKIEMEAGSSLIGLNSLSTRINGPDIDIRSQSEVSISGSFLQLDGAPILVGGFRVARVGSLVSVDPNTGIGTIIQ